MTCRQSHPKADTQQGYNAGHFPVITRRDFTKLASFAAGSIMVSSRSESQGKQPAEARNPSAVTSGFIQNGGAEIYYECSGAGPAIVFAHGLGGIIFRGGKAGPAVSHRYTCVTFAHRGFSPSRVASGTADPALFEGDLLALVDHLKLAEVRLVAQSMGGWACLNFALHHPQRIRALVMAATGGAADPNMLGEADRKAVEDRQAAHQGIEAELQAGNSPCRRGANGARATCSGILVSRNRPAQQRPR